MSQSEYQTSLAFIQDLPIQLNMHLHDDLEAILALKKLTTQQPNAVMKHHRFTFSLKKKIQYRIFQYKNERNEELIIKVTYRRHFFNEKIEISPYFNFKDVDLHFLEVMLTCSTQALSIAS